MSKVAFLVLGNQAPAVLDRVLDTIDHALFRVFLHVDAKRDLGDYTRTMRNIGRITVVEPRVPVFWGGYSMIEAEMVLIRAALADPSVGTFVMLSDDTAPVRSPAVIHAALEASSNRMSFDVRDDVQHWYRNFYLPDAGFSMYRDRGWWERTVGEGDVALLRRLAAAREQGKKDIGRIFFSRQWWSLERRCLEALVGDMDNDDHLVESFRFSVMSDETMFPTLFQRRFPGLITLGVPMWLQFTPHCRTFHTESEIAEVRVAPEHLFMRKIHPDRPDLVELAADLGRTVAVAVHLPQQD